MSTRAFHFTTAVLLLIAPMIYCGACASLSPQHLGHIEKEKETQPFDIGKKYVFDNYPCHIRNLVTEPIPDEKRISYMLWRNIEPRFKVTGSDWLNYNVNIEFKRKNRMEFTLTDPSGNIIKKKNQRYKQLNSFFKIKPKFWLWNNYFLINGFSSQISAFTLDQEGKLIVPQHFIDGAFLIVMPFAGSQNTEIYQYQSASSLAK